MPTIIKGDIGTILEATVVDEQNAPLDLSGADIIKLKMRDPLGKSFERIAVLTTDGLDGTIRYVTVEGDFPLDGLWHLQWYIKVGTLVRFHTSLSEMAVLPHFEPNI